jgi:transposase
LKYAVRATKGSTTTCVGRSRQSSGAFRTARRGALSHQTKGPGEWRPKLHQSNRVQFKTSRIRDSRLTRHSSCLANGSTSTSGFLFGVLVHAADIQDADSAWDLLKKIKHLYCWLKVVFADSIYNRLSVLLACFLLGLTLIIVRRIAGTTGFVVIPRRWIVERTLGWFGRWRRLSKDYEELPEVSEAMVTLAAILMMLQRLVHPNRKRLPPP